MSGADHGGGAEHQEKKEKPAKPALKQRIQMLWTTRLGLFVDRQWGILKEMLGSFRTGDPRTRRMVVVFVFSILSVVGVSVLSIYRVISVVREHQQAQRERDAAQSMSEFFARQADESQKKSFTAILGEFSFEVKDSPTYRDPEMSEAEFRRLQASAGVVQVAEAEIMVECTTEETCHFIEKALPVVRNYVTNVLIEIEREELMTREGKRRVRKQIADRINGWLGSPRVTNVYFSKLVLD